ncbi:MAG: hypothetical protein KME64_14240 [Scytonematopsis contorta HA4267-MV1]|jgi:hypothetical protein|nr:hypothetical protein [Scytonematopsis contorta HA4267-MV1]
MKTEFDYPNKDLLGSFVFRPSFNHFEKINANQAWSLFFTGGKDDKKWGEKTQLGKLFTYTLIAGGVSRVLWSVYFGHLA